LARLQSVKRNPVLLSKAFSCISDIRLSDIRCTDYSGSRRCVARASWFLRWTAICRWKRARRSNAQPRVDGWLSLPLRTELRDARQGSFKGCFLRSPDIRLSDLRCSDYSGLLLGVARARRLFFGGGRRFVNGSGRVDPTRSNFCWFGSRRKRRCVVESGLMERRNAAVSVRSAHRQRA